MLTFGEVRGAAEPSMSRDYAGAEFVGAQRHLNTTSILR